MRKKSTQDLLQWNVSEPGINDPAKKIDVSLIRRRVRLINLAASVPFKWALCLQRSVALREWLSRDGQPTSLRIGVRKSEGNFEAHAWLECQGMVINDFQSVTEEYMAFAPNSGLLGGEASNARLEWTQ